MKKTQLNSPLYRPDIDGLRALAVLAVVAFHAFPSVIRGGFIGVDVFFVISGYLISMIIFTNLDMGTFSFSEFYVRRIKRIFPALLIVLITCFIFGWLLMLPDEFKQLGKHIVGGVTFSSNFLFWSEAGYFDRLAETKPLLHLWSLGIEGQFYILWPLLLWISWNQKLNLFIIMLIVAAISFILNLRGVKQDIIASFYSPQSRFWEFLCGSLLAWITLYKKEVLNNINNKIDARLSYMFYSAKQKHERKMLTNVVSFIGLFILLLGFWRIKKELSFPGQWALVPVFGTALIILAGSKPYINRVFLSNKITIWFGLISFPLYLWHWPLLSFAAIAENEWASYKIRIAAVALSFVLAWITYINVEVPFRSGRYIKVKIIALLMMIIIVGCIGYIVYEKNGLPLRKSINNLNSYSPIVRIGEDDKKSHEICLKSYGLSKFDIHYCRLSAPGNVKPHIALIGDSHAASLFPGLSKILSNSNEGLLMLGGRLFIDVATFPNGSEFQVNVYKGGIIATNFVALEKTIDTVIMVSRGPFYINDDWNFYLIDNKKIIDKRKVFEIGMRKTLDLMIANNKKVVFVLDSPEMNFYPEKCQPSRLFNKPTFECAISRSAYNDRHLEYRELMFKVLKDYPAVLVFDQSAYLCDKFKCKFKQGSSILYGDADHLSLAGSDFMADKLIRVLKGYSSAILN